MAVTLTNANENTGKILGSPIDPAAIAAAMGKTATGPLATGPVVAAGTEGKSTASPPSKATEISLAGIDLTKPLPDAVPATTLTDAQPDAGEGANLYKVELIYNPPKFIAADNEMKAIQTYAQLCGIRHTKHSFKVEKL